LTSISIRGNDGKYGKQFAAVAAFTEDGVDVATVSRYLPSGAPDR
jgi:hypothetical protein